MPSANDRAAHIRQRYDALASRYDRMISSTERVLLSGGRAWVGAQARGEILEIAVGTGRNLPFYRAGATLAGIDLSPAMVQIARERARRLGVTVELVVGDAEELPFDNAAFDTVVSTLSICTIPDPELALREAWRVLRSGGRFVALEHVRSPNPAVRLVQRMLNPLSVRYACDHLLREPEVLLERAGFEIEQLERSKLGIIQCVIARRAG